MFDVTMNNAISRNKSSFKLQKGKIGSEGFMKNFNAKPFDLSLVVFRH